MLCPPDACTSAMACRATVVLPDDSGPYTSIIRPRGYPPTLMQRSSASEPLEDVAISKSVFHRVS